LDDFGAAGLAYRETNDAHTTLADVIDDLLTGQYSNPVRVVAFNTGEGWARDVSENVAWDVVKRAAKKRQNATYAYTQVRRILYRIRRDVALKTLSFDWPADPRSDRSRFFLLFVLLQLVQTMLMMRDLRCPLSNRSRGARLEQPLLGVVCIPMRSTPGSYC
jgi:hypothetical protein